MRQSRSNNFLWNFKNIFVQDKVAYLIHMIYQNLASISYYFLDRVFEFVRHTFFIHLVVIFFSFFESLAILDFSCFCFLFD